ncbi:hypothetical protein [Streptomyces indiaensis]|uniref:Secreted protein n=1 Tax=Streptomyces indiaensis TaxID=284033 RepID=A0ABP5QPD2_9ACTN|nr:hypothetical protein [Streptomyces indiaensis]MCF1645973.1 hypothetical protein [Streptomyces indiaensis]
MTDASTVVPLVTGLGGAVIGAAAAVWVPMLQRRHQSRDEERAFHERLLREEISRLTRLRTTGRAWFDVLLRAHQSLEAGRDVDLDRFDDELMSTSTGAASAGYQPPSPTADPSREVEDLSARIFDQLQDLSWEIRSHIIRSPGPGAAIPDFSRRIAHIKDLRAALNVRLLERIEQLSRQLPP